MEIKKVLTSGILAAILLTCSFSGCAGSDSGDNTPPENTNYGLLKELDALPAYEDDGSKMIISLMNEPRPNANEEQEAWQILAESGINTLMSWGHNERYLELCEQFGLDYMPYVHATKPQEYTVPITPEDIPDFMRGFDYQDEPSYKGLDVFDELAKNHAEKFPDKYMMVNLHPAWFDPTKPWFGINGQGVDKIEYEEYVAKFCDIVYSHITENRYISVDVYPLNNNMTINNNWLKTYEVIGEYAKEYDALFHFYVICEEKYGYRKLTLEDLRWVINVGLTYGGKAFSYFVYTNYSEAEQVKPMTSANGLIKYDNYYLAQQVNRELTAWDHVLLNFKWQGTMCVLGKGNTSNANYDPLTLSLNNIDIIKSVEASQDTLIGRFTGKDGEIGLMVTNFCKTEAKKTDKVDLELLEANKAIVYVNGNRSEVDVVNGKLTLNIEPGDAAFVIPCELKK